MSKKDFQNLARALNEVKPTFPMDTSVWSNCVSTISEVCRRSNSRFDHTRFIEACETGTTRGMR